MADIRLYNIQKGIANVKSPVNLKYEREIQSLCETNLETFFGIRFLETEFYTGKNHGGKIDSLGIDENNCPVIIEYKLDSKENVINQGLFYLDWLMDHRPTFELLCMKKNVLKDGEEVDWSNPRLLCIAKDFTRYDDYAIKQINRNIELIRYRVFDGDHIIFEQASTSQEKGNSHNTLPAKYRNMEDAIKAATDDLLSLYQELEDYIFSLGDDIQKKELKYYHAFSRIKNFVCVELRTKKKDVVIYLKINYNSIKNPTSNIRDVSNIGHYGTGDTEITIKTIEDLNAIKYLIEESYRNS